MSEEGDYEEYEEEEYDPNAEENGYNSETEENNNLSEEKQNRNLKDSLITQKLNLVLRFNADAIDIDLYFRELKIINRKLEEIGDLDIDLAEHEYEFMELLENYISKIRETKRVFTLTPEEVKKIKNLELKLNNIRLEYYKNKKDDDFEPIESSIFENKWKDLDESEQNKIKILAKKMNIVFPVKENYKSFENFKNAENNFYISMLQYLPGYWEYYELKEEKQIITIAKNNNIPIPKKNNYNTQQEYSNALKQFYKKIEPYIPGYVYKMNVTTLGSAFELLSEVSITENVKEQTEFIKRLPIQLSETELQRINNHNIVKPILNKLDKEYLIDCIQNYNTKKTYDVSKPVKTNITGKTLKINEKIVPSNFYKKLHKIIVVTPPIKLTKNEIILKQKRELINKEILNRNTRLQIKKLIEPHVVADRQVEKPQSTEKITSRLRRISKEKLLKKLIKDVNPELTVNSTTKINNIEEYIFKLTSNSFKEYTNKIKDILFIFDNYKTFKNGLLNGDINIYQLVLFEKEIKREADKIIFKPSIKNRKLVLDAVKNLLLSKNILFKNSKILTDIIITNRSRILELLLYDISNTDTEYFDNLSNLLKLINSKFYLQEIIIGKISSEQVLLIMNQKDYTIITSIDYSLFTLKEINALIDQEDVLYKNLVLEKNKLEAENNNGQFIINWNPSRSGLVEDADIKQWEILKNKFLKNNINVSNINNDVLLNGYTKELEYFKQVLMKKYRIEIDPRIIKINSNLKDSTDKKNQLNKVRVDKLVINRSKSIIPEPIKISNEYKLINETLVYQLIQLYKRKIFIDDYGLSQISKNKLIEIIEIIDLNNLNYNLGIINKYIYEKIKYLKFTEFNGNYEENNEKYLLKSIIDISNFLGVGNSFEQIVKYFPRNYQNQKKLLDFYGEDIFLKLYKNIDPLKFYTETIRRYYNKLVINNSPKNNQEITKLQILFNPNNGQFGKNAYDGYLFDVYMLDKDPFTKLPIVLYTHTEIKEPDGQVKYKKVSVEKSGKFPFIKIPRRTNKPNEIIYNWIEVPIGFPQMYKVDYDSCSRFKKDSDCNGQRGLANSPCFYNNGVCKANYSNK